MAEVHVFYSGGGAILVGTKYMLYYTLLTLYSTAIECFNEALPMAEVHVFDSGWRASRGSAAGQYNIAYRDRHQDGTLIRSPSSSQP